MTIPAMIAHDDINTLEEYLALERQAEYKSEYIDGQIVAMSGGTKRHSRIKVSLNRLLSTRFLEGPCDLFDVDLRVRVDATMYTYPDLSVVCGESEVEDAEEDDVLLNPTAIFEVLSPSTERYDRGEKFRRYQRMPSLREYVLVSQDSRRMEVYSRDRDQPELWHYRDHGAGGLATLASLGIAIEVDAVYASPLSE